ncbi:MAG: hypothetical protein LBI67_00275 [Treponema sp.]|jgi:hypothetical protein|nr:hypothetical protein [Treponema sp.]
MTIEEFCEKLVKLLSGLPASGFNGVDDSVMADLDSYAPVAEEVGMKQGKKLIENLSGVLKNCKKGASADENVSIRLTALDFYIKKIKSGSTEDL